jgi:hypothetical protein
LIYFLAGGNIGYMREIEIKRADDFENYFEQCPDCKFNLEAIKRAQNIMPIKLKDKTAHASIEIVCQSTPDLKNNVLNVGPRLTIAQADGCRSSHSFAVEKVVCPGLQAKRRASSSKESIDIT